MIHNRAGKQNTLLKWRDTESLDLSQESMGWQYTPPEGTRLFSLLLSRTAARRQCAQSPYCSKLQ